MLLRVTVDDAGCWMFNGAVDSGGYGMIRADGRNLRAHVVTFAAAHGFVPANIGLVVDHLCRVRRCCRPEHLESVTNAENVARGLGAARTVCRRGHLMTPENIYLRPDGKGRQCRECIHIRSERTSRRRLSATKARPPFP